MVLFAGIAAAFALDSWWDRRDERRLLHLEMQSVREDLALARDELAFFVETHRRKAASAERLIEMQQTAALAGESSVTVSDSLVVALYMSPTYDPPLGGIRVLVNSGRMALVQTEELRTALSGWEDRVVDAKEDEIWAKDFILDRVWPRLIYDGPPAQSARIAELNVEFWNRQTDVEAREIPLTSRPFSLATDDEMHGVLLLTQSFSVASLQELEHLAVAGDSLIALLDAELGR